ncbi:MAG: autotransporter domain-containing protein [Elusimicrobia bacterium]|nr:autotransporter domain-containing protein [Elusimicrobiota bacterium]
MITSPFRRAVLSAAFVGLLLPAFARANTTIVAGPPQQITTSNAPGLGVITFNNGTLQNGSAGGSYSNSLILATNYNGTIDANGLTSTFSGLISGGGNVLTLTDGVGGGQISISGANTYTGVTVIDGVKVGVANLSAFGGPTNGIPPSLSLTGATLLMQTGGTLTNNMQVNGNANVLDANGNTATFSGTIFGTGGLTVQDSGGSGLIALTGTSYYTGPTTVVSGLTVGLGGSSFGTGAATLDGSNTLRFVSAANMPNAFTFLGNTTLDAYGSAATLSGTITGGANSVTVQDTNGGAGVVTLSGSGNTWTGGTTINSGTLALGIINGLPTNGALNVNAVGTFDMMGFNQQITNNVTNNGTLRTGAATLNITGNYTAASGSTLGVYPIFTAPSLNVSGAAALSGQTLSIEQRPASGNYVIVSAGTLPSDFNSTVHTASGYTATLTLSGTKELLSLKAPSLVMAGQTANQASVAGGINTANGAASTDLAMTIGQLNTMAFTPSQQAQFNATLDQLGPIAYSALSGLATAGAGLQTQAVSARAAALQAGRGGVDESGLASASPYPGTLVADGGGGPVPLVPFVNPLDTPWGTFASVLYTSGRLDGINGASGFQPGYAFNAFGGTAGADYRFSDSFAAGFSGGYVTGSSMLGDGLGEATNSSLRLGGYETYWNGAFHQTTYLGTAFDSFTTSRNIVNLGRTATASPSGMELNFDSSAGYDLKRGRTTLTPTVGLDYDRLSVAGFTESGAGALDLSAAPFDFNSLRSSLGAKISHRYGDWFTFTPSASAAWEHEFANQSRAISAQFANGGAGALSVNTADVSREALAAGVGFAFGFGTDVTADLGASEDLRSDFVARTANVDVRVRF